MTSRRVGIFGQLIKEMRSHQILETLGQATVMLELPDSESENLHEGPSKGLVPVLVIEIPVNLRKNLLYQRRALIDFLQRGRCEDLLRSAGVQSELGPQVDSPTRLRLGKPGFEVRQLDLRGKQ